MGELPVGNGAVALDAKLAEALQWQRRFDRQENCGSGAAVGMDVRATAIGAWIAVRVILSQSRVIVSGVGLQAAVVMVMSAAQSIVHVLMNECVSLGELRRMQDRQLASAEHCHGEEHRNHDLFHEPAHSGFNRPASAAFVKWGIVSKSSSPVIWLTK